MLSSKVPHFDTKQPTMFYNQQKSGLAEWVTPTPKTGTTQFGMNMQLNQRKLIPYDSAGISGLEPFYLIHLCHRNRENLALWAWCGNAWIGHTTGTWRWPLWSLGEGVKIIGNTLIGYISSLDNRIILWYTHCSFNLYFKKILN